MKNEKEFKKRISEMAARIAEESPNKSEPDAEKVKAVLVDMEARLKGPLSAINKASELKEVIKGMVGMMPNMQGSAILSALSVLSREMAGKAADDNPSKPVSKKSPNAAYDGMPVPDNLKEAYDKIRKK
jgi:hypothetical protein